ncbi:MAG: hydrophobe/amphiphile efflux-3 (HAE3) family protein [Gammaproteobacteria bacterium]|jgi:hydrophobe/amphiphile efflux-3 (HAE3) family protein
MILKLFMFGFNDRKGVFLGLLLATLFFAAGLPKLQVDTGVDSLIPANDPARLIYQRVSGEFGTDNKTIIYIRDSQLWTPAKLGIVEKLHEAIEKTEYVTRVDSIYSLHTVVGGEGKIDTKPLLREAPRTEEEAQIAKESALANPLYRGNFFSDDGNVTAMIVSVENIDDVKDFHRNMYEALEALLLAHRSEFERLVQVGSPRINAELKSSLYEDFILLGPLSAIILVLSILFFMRNVLSAFIPVVTSALTIIWTFGMLGWTGIPINILSAMLPSLIIVIGSTEDTHLLSGFFRGLATADKEPRKEAIAYMASHIGLPLILTILTTALGFASNLFSDIGLIQQFAIASTFAMLANGIITILAVPMLLYLFGPDKAKTVKENETFFNLPGKMVKLFCYSKDHYPGAILLSTALLCLFFIYQASNLYVTNDPLSYFPEDRPLIQDTQRIHKDLAGIKIFFITLESNKENTFQQPKNIAKLAEIQGFMKKQGVFDRTISLADHLTFVNREFRGDFAELSLPETRQLVAQYLMFFHRSDLDSYVSHDYSSANIVVRHNISDSHTLNRYVEELEDAVSHIAGPGIKSSIIGENLMVNRAAEHLMTAQVKALIILLVLVFIIMSAMFTSLKGGFIALVPAIIPIALMFGIMGLLDIPLNPGTAMVAVIAIGIAVDGTIHLLARYNELCRRTSDYKTAVDIAVAEEATPLIVSSIALSLGFGILLFSNFTIVAQFGALAAATMLFSIFANLLITPIIMSKVRLVGLYQILSMKIDKSVLDCTPLFNNMTNYQRRKAILISEMNEFEAGELLVEQGTLGRDMYLILEGQAEVVRRDDGEARTLATLNPGAVFGEIGYIREAERTADVRATTAITALRFDYEKMQSDLKFFPNIVAKLNFNISYILGERLADMVEHSKK